MTERIAAPGAPGYPLGSVRRFFARSVGRKLALAVCAVLSVFSLAFVSVLLRVSHQSARDLNESWLDLLTDTVSGSVTAALENDQKQHGDRFQRVVHDAAAGHQEIKAIRLLDMQGKIVFSSLPKEVGQAVDPSIASSLPTIKDEKPSPAATPELDDSESAPLDGVLLRLGEGRMDSLRPIRNDAACMRCHGTKQAQLGVLQIAVSTRKADAEVAHFERMLTILAILPVFFVVGTILVFTRFLVYKPLRSLTKTIRKAEEGDFLHRADVPGENEIATLAKDFNSMLGRITTLTAQNMERERELAQAQQEMRNRAALDEKARIIDSTNRELSGRNKELAILFDLGQRISSTLALQETFDALTNIVGEKLGYRQFSVMLWDDKVDALVVKATYGFEEEIKGMSFKKGEGIAGECVRTGERILIPDTRKESRYLHYKGRRHTDGALLCLPMKVKDRVVGVLAFERTALEGFVDSEILFLEAISNAAAIAIENAQLYARMQELSATDELTRVANRRAFQERLEHELRRADRFHRNVSVLMIDIDYFKKFNDTHGHLDGDQVLQRASAVFRENVREVDLVARYGGEEFVVVLPDADKVEAGAVAEKLRNRVAKTRFPKAETQPGGKLTISIGVASYPTDAPDGEGLLNSADFSLYRAKETGRNRVVIFDEALRRDLEKVTTGTRGS